MMASDQSSSARPSQDERTDDDVPPKTTGEEEVKPSVCTSESLHHGEVSTSTLSTKTATPSSSSEKHSPEEMDASRIISHGFTTSNDSQEKDTDVGLPSSQQILTLQPPCQKGKRETEPTQATASSTPTSPACVTPDSEKVKKEERQKGSKVAPMTGNALREGLELLSSVLLISSNALKDQVQYLPDSLVPPADYSYDEHDEENTGEQTATLRREFRHLLFDRDTQRANFLAVPKEVLELLRGVWNLNEDPTLSDRVEKKLVPVQSFFPNLHNYLLRTPGFPTASDVFDADIFRGLGKKKVKAIEDEFTELLRATLEGMGYPCDGHEIEFYLSFMRTRQRTVVQDPHIDFKFETVDPWYVDESSSSRRRSKRGRKLDYKERVPFIALFPLSPDGMAVEVWEARDDHQFGRPGVLVHIPFGCMMIARGDVVHAGGFSNSPYGNPRCHLYVYRSGGEVHDINTSNSYTMEIDGKTMRMSQLYQHGPGI